MTGLLRGGRIPGPRGADTQEKRFDFPYRIDVEADHDGGSDDSCGGEQALDVGAPVAQYLPEFRDVKVGVDGAPPKRPLTVHDQMRHTSGLTYGLFGNSPVDQMYLKANVFRAKSLEEMVKTIASLPLLHQPGEFWEYSVSIDALGRIVEVVRGKDLDTFVRGRLTGPLKMNDTGWHEWSSNLAG